MNKFSTLFIASFFMVLTSCEQKPSESNTANSPVTDSTKKEPTAEAKPEITLTEKGTMVAKSWKAAQIETPTVKLSGEFVDIKFNFKADGTFEYSEDGKKDEGKWKLNQEETMIMLEYSDGRKADHDIKELSEDKMTIAGKEHGMYRTLTLAKK
jgi:hypothetical protein